MFLQGPFVTCPRRRSGRRRPCSGQLPLVRVNRQLSLAWIPSTATNRVVGLSGTSQVLPRGTGDSRNDGGYVPPARLAYAFGVWMVACAIVVLGHRIVWVGRDLPIICSNLSRSACLFMSRSLKNVCVYGKNSAFMKGNLGGFYCFPTV